MQVLDNFESSYSKFLDARQSWDSLEALQANTDILMPNGFKAFCKEEAKWYILTATDETDPSTYTWNEDGGTDEEAISLASTAITMVSEVNEKAEEALATAATAIAAIDNIGSDEAKLDKVNEMPAEPSDDDTVLYIGETTENYTKGHIYQYSNGEWNDLTGSDKSKLEKVSEMLNDVSFGDTVLYIGETNENYTKGHIYSKDTHNWKDITPTIISKIIPPSNSSELLIYNGDGYKYTEYDINDSDNPKSLNLYQLVDENYFITPDTSVQYELYSWYNGSQSAFTKKRYPSSDETLYNYDGTVNTEYNFVRYDSENDELYVKMGNSSEFSLSYASFQNVRRKYYERNDKVYVPGHIYRIIELKGYENDDLNKTYYITSNEAAVGDLLYDENGVFTGKTIEQVNENTITVDETIYRFRYRLNTYVDTQEQSFVFDKVPTENSKNFINSGAVYNSITEVNEKAEEALATAATAIAAIDNIGSDETKLDKVYTIPVEPSDNDTVLYIGTTTENYVKGHIYQYSETDTEWKDLTSAGFSIEKLAPAFDETVSYNADTIVTYNNELYICTVEHSASEWNSENFTKITVSELLSNINEKAEEALATAATAISSISETNEKAEEALATAATAIAAANISSPTLTENITPNIEVGGIGVGDTLTTGQQITDVLKKLLVKYFEPVITLSADKALINKKGATIEAPITITATAEKKSDDVIFYSINYDGNDVSTGNNPDGGEITYTHQTDISTDTIFIGSISDGKSTINKTIKFEFINPYYYGSVNDNEISDFTGLTEEIVKKNINKKVSYTASAEYLVFAYDATYGDLTSIKDKNNFENLPAFTKTVMEVNGENYNVYISSDKITCSNFEYTFSI